MESTSIYRKPKKWVAAVLGLFIPPAGMLYVARPGWAAAYFALALIVVLGNMFAPRGMELAGGAIALLVAIISAIHAYRLACDNQRDPRVSSRPGLQGAQAPLVQPLVWLGWNNRRVCGAGAWNSRFPFRAVPFSVRIDDSIY